MMKRVIVAAQNALVSEAILNALKKRGMFAERTSSGESDAIVSMCSALFADVLVMDVTRFGDGTFDQRMRTADEARKGNRNLKICFVCDNVSDEEPAFRVVDAKAVGRIDAFFYQSVPSDYIADVIGTM